jgi:hypothetical protein
MFSGTDPTAFVVSLNLRRRHLAESQGSMAAARRLANIRVGDNVGNQCASPIGEGQTTQSRAAELLNVSTRSAASAREVIDESQKPGSVRSKLSSSPAAALGEE